MSYFVTGTDTDIGKTIACSWLMLQGEKAHYWKPIQAGQEEQDILRVKALTQLKESRFEKSAYNLKEPLSPHESARRENITIDLDLINLPMRSDTMIVEGAGGVLVPLNENTLMIDLMIKLNMPIILVARTSLGTINHTLLTIELLRSKGLSLKGVILNGTDVPHNREAIKHYGRIKIIAEIPKFKNVTLQALQSIKPQQNLYL